MLNRYNANTRKFNRVYVVPPKIPNNDITGSLVGVSKPTKQNSVATKHNVNSIPHIVKEVINTDITGSLEGIESPSTTHFHAVTKSSPIVSKITNTKNTHEDFNMEIIEFSAMKIQKQPNEINSVDKKFIIYNTSLEYGTDGVTSQNIEIYVNGLTIPPSVYSIKQIGINIEIELNEELFDLNILETQNVIIIGKFSDIILELQEIDDIGLTDENEQYLIL